MTHTSGTTKIKTKNRFFFGKDVSGTGSIQTHHEHYTDFILEGKAFRAYGDYIFKDGDKIVCYASFTNSGFYDVKFLKNFTRNTGFGMPRESIFELCKMLGGFTIFVFIVSFIVMLLTSPATTLIVWFVLEILLCGGYIYLHINEKKTINMEEDDIVRFPEF